MHARDWGNGGEVYAIRILDYLASDVGVLAINAPAAFLQTGQSIAPQSVIKNFGTSAASFNAVCTIYDSLSQLLYADTVAVSNPCRHVWTSYNFMMRVFTEAQIGISEQENEKQERFAVNAPLPNPFVNKRGLMLRSRGMGFCRQRFTTSPEGWWKRYMMEWSAAEFIKCSGAEQKINLSAPASIL